MCHLRFQAFPHRRQLFTALAQHTQPEWFHFEIAPGPPSAFGRRIAVVGSDIAFALQTLQRAVQRANRQQSSRAALDLTADRHTIAVVSQTQYREQDDLFELTEVATFSHICSES